MAAPLYRADGWLDLDPERLVNKLAIQCTHIASLLALVNNAHAEGRAPVVGQSADAFRALSHAMSIFLQDLVPNGGGMPGAHSPSVPKPTPFPKPASPPRTAPTTAPSTAPTTAPSTAPTTAPSTAPTGAPSTAPLISVPLPSIPVSSPELSASLEASTPFVADAPRPLGTVLKGEDKVFDLPRPSTPATTTVTPLAALPHKHQVDPKAAATHVAEGKTQDVTKEAARVQSKEAAAAKQDPASVGTVPVLTETKKVVPPTAPLPKRPLTPLQQANRVFCQQAETRGLAVCCFRGVRHGWQWHDKLVMTPAKQAALEKEVLAVLGTASPDDEKALRSLEKPLRQLFGGCSLMEEGDNLKVRYVTRLVNSYHEDDEAYDPDGKTNDWPLFNTAEVVKHCREGGLDGGRTLYEFVFETLPRDKFKLST